MRSLKTPADFAMDLWRDMCGLPEVEEQDCKYPELKNPKKLRANIEEEMAPFFRYMVNCIIIGSYRYQPLSEKKKLQKQGKSGRYMEYLKTKYELWSETGNDELLVDIANLAWLEFWGGVHPKKHLKPFTTPDELRLGFDGGK